MRLLDTLEYQENSDSQEYEYQGVKAKKDKSNKLKKRAVVTQIIPRDGIKDKVISAKVNSAMYNVFTDICKVQGLSNNSCLNMILSDYVREKKYLLDEE